MDIDPLSLTDVGWVSIGTNCKLGLKVVNLLKLNISYGKTFSGGGGFQLICTNFCFIRSKY